MWRPVVGSSRMYSVFPVERFDNSVASLTRCASPPDNVVDDCPNFIYPNPTSLNVWTTFLIRGTFSKNVKASSTVISSTSAIDFPLYLTSSVSLLYLVPLHTSQGT